MKLRRRAILVLLLCALAGLVACILWPTDGGPVYQGKNLQQWINDFYWGNTMDEHGRVHSEKRVAAADAVQHIGTNALPCLLRWIAYEPAPWKRRAERILDKIPIRPVQSALWKPRKRGIEAMNAFEALGATASPAVPELVRMARNPSAMESGNRAVFALGLVGKEGLPPPIEMLESGRMANDATEVSVIGMLGYGVDISSAVPMLLLRHHYYLWDKLKERPDFVVPALTNCLRHPNARVRAEAANALHWLGATARPAVGALLSALQDPDPAVRDAATNALHEITMAASKRSDAIQ